MSDGNGIEFPKVTCVGWGEWMGGDSSDLSFFRYGHSYRGECMHRIVEEKPWKKRKPRYSISTINYLYHTYCPDYFDGKLEYSAFNYVLMALSCVVGLLFCISIVYLIHRDWSKRRRHEQTETKEKLKGRRNAISGRSRTLSLKAENTILVQEATPRDSEISLINIDHLRPPEI